ncbi:NAD(P)/FAD-dependent oxidoreductase [Lacimicrobium alkaliphilum]|uniref:FAD-dependent oxidoreductase n=1 Tax=Lacimicrobium alkaliphilum TaxID=1526571 RepID=A0ABQ1RH77_9ALTE|nr:NAD(P)-binding protein [Lacimicrobium alkaliphilum]GGD67944.1 FAD-dependent oxidoreductase [Lacimicrobium alkaliphilum]
MAKIAIIGAGVSGSLLAYKLSLDGHAVSILEKSRGRGGRCTSKRTEWGRFDIGAPFIRTHDEKTINLLSQLEGAEVARRWSVSPVDYTFNSQMTTDVQAQHTDERFYVFTPGMNAACQYWQQYCELITSARITRIQQNGSGWKLSDQQGEYGVFDWVITTLPWPQVHPLLAEHFEGLPPQSEAQWLSCRTLAMQFDNMITPPSDLIYLHNSSLQLLVCDSAKPGREKATWPIWVAHSNHIPSTENLCTDESDWAEGACAQVAAIFGQTSLMMRHRYQHVWRYARLSHQGQRPGILLDPAKRLAAAGDWCIGGSIPAAIKAVQRLHSQLAQIL